MKLLVLATCVLSLFDQLLELTLLLHLINELALHLLAWLIVLLRHIGLGDLLLHIYLAKTEGALVLSCLSWSSEILHHRLVRFVIALVRLLAQIS